MVNLNTNLCSYNNYPSVNRNEPLNPSIPQKIPVDIKIQQIMKQEAKNIKDNSRWKPAFDLLKSILIKIKNFIKPNVQE